MTARALVALVRQNLARSRRSFALSVFGIAVGIASLTFFLALSAGVRHVVLGQVFPVGQIEVVPSKSSLGESSIGGLFSSLSGTEAARPRTPRDQLAARPEVQRRLSPRQARLSGARLGRRRDPGQELLHRAGRRGRRSARRWPASRSAPSRSPTTSARHKQCNADADCSRRRILPVGHARLRAAGAGGDLALHRRALQRHHRAADRAAQDRQVPRRPPARHHLQHRARPLVHRQPPRAASSRTSARSCSSASAARRAAGADLAARLRAGVEPAVRRRRAARCRRWCSQLKRGRRRHAADGGHPPAWATTSPTRAPSAPAWPSRW